MPSAVMLMAFFFEKMITQLQSSILVSNSNCLFDKDKRNNFMKITFYLFICVFFIELTNVGKVFEKNIL